MLVDQRISKERKIPRDRAVRSRAALLALLLFLALAFWIRLRDSEADAAAEALQGEEERMAVW
jgi:hypothetical protein